MAIKHQRAVEAINLYNLSSDPPPSSGSFIEAACDFACSYAEDPPHDGVKILDLALDFLLEFSPYPEHYCLTREFMELLQSKFMKLLQRKCMKLNPRQSLVLLLTYVSCLCLKELYWQDFCLDAVTQPGLRGLWNRWKYGKYIQHPGLAAPGSPMPRFSTAKQFSRPGYAPGAWGTIKASFRKAFETKTTDFRSVFANLLPGYLHREPWTEVHKDYAQQMSSATQERLDNLAKAARRENVTQTTPSGNQTTDTEADRFAPGFPGTLLWQSQVTNHPFQVIPVAKGGGASPGQEINPHLPNTPTAHQRRRQGCTGSHYDH